jgi:DNA-binding NarL/FixJ family response regulator
MVRRGRGHYSRAICPPQAIALSPPPPIRTLLVHDRIPANRPVRDAVGALPGLALVATVWTRERVEHALRVDAPELVLVDWQLAAASPSELCHFLKTRLLAPKVIAIMPGDGQAHRDAAALAGADACISRDMTEAGLERVVAQLFADRGKA